MKIAVIYHSESGNTAKVAELIAEGARLNEGVEVQTMSITDVDKDFVAKAKAVFLGTPVYLGSFSRQMKDWLDTGKIKLHLSAHAMTDAETGEDSDYTHRSGIFSDMKMLWLRFTRKPRVRRLEDKGGGPRAIVDAIFMYGCDNPAQLMAVLTDSDS